ncbi:endopeptidase La [Thermovibrio ammonificans]|jgi:ATP-dependent Lon protease|uniref:Lon protease n=1 Tax=Thermovibrio ammonificans (strain DSM 15698 / JCM 12110 / HB-1) TaxID=648996 RepID=E8T3Z6_THEA1|nr:endopeptidase La [Thermovibrio ammonificans]ADU96206.1 ATP-dependent protease La [Thermovibrio ammonificans HB-1]
MAELIQHHNNVEEPKFPEELPVLPLRDVVVFPMMIAPLFVGRPFSLNAVEEALKEHKLIFLATQKDKDVEEPKREDLYDYGTVAVILKAMKMGDGRVKILVQGLGRAKIKELKREGELYKAVLEHIPEGEYRPKSIEEEALVKLVKDQLERVVALGKQIPPDMVAILRSVEDPGRLADLIAGQLDLSTEEAVEILSTVDPIERLKKVSEKLEHEIKVLEVQELIRAKARESMEKEQREYFLRQQLKAIRKELGEEEERSKEIEEYREKIKRAKMPKEVEEAVLKELARLEKMHPESAEAAVLRTWLEWMIELPWSKRTRDRLDIERARRILDEDHYDLEKVKDRILEYLAVKALIKKRKKRIKEVKQPTICFVGPPGVGKTSLARSIAKALGRKFVRISLGGVRDEAEIRGHRRTYVGAMPGKIIQAIKKAGTKNPVILLDEIDKMASDFRGDPAAALLEVLDPEQNREFVDNYINHPFDLSEVLFIATANTPHTIPEPLYDRLEVLNIPGYTEYEKLQIAKKYIVPKQLKNHGLTPEDVEFTDSGLLHIIRHYTREAGVRNLDRKIAAICRKVALWITEGKEKKYRVTKKLVEKILGAPKFVPELELGEDEVGVATGLAWTPVGGDVLFIEAIVTGGSGRLILTGRLGEVMKESAQAALGFIKANAEKYNIDKDFSKIDIHVHVPAGAIPKDGPSAGITIATAMLSALTGRKVRKDVAMTGEITLGGKVLPVGGLKEKVLAALRYGVKTVILPEKNKQEVLEELPEEAKRKIKLVFVDRVEPVFELALYPEEKRKQKSKRKKKAKEEAKK